LNAVLVSSGYHTDVLEHQQLKMLLSLQQHLSAAANANPLTDNTVSNSISPIQCYYCHSKTMKQPLRRTKRSNATALSLFLHENIKKTGCFTLGFGTATLAAPSLTHQVYSFSRIPTSSLPD